MFWKNRPRIETAEDYLVQEIWGAVNRIWVAFARAAHESGIPAVPTARFEIGCWLYSVCCRSLIDSDDDSIAFLQACAMVGCRGETWLEMSDYDTLFPILRPRFDLYCAIARIHEGRRELPVDCSIAVVAALISQALCQKDPESIDPRLFEEAFEIPWLYESLPEAMKALGPANEIPTTPAQRDALNRSFARVAVPESMALEAEWNGFSAFPDLYDMPSHELRKIGRELKMASVNALIDSVK